MEMGGIAPFPLVSYVSDKSEDTGLLSVNGKQNWSLLNVCNMRGLNLKPNQSVKQSRWDEQWGTELERSGSMRV